MSSYTIIYVSEFHEREAHAHGFRSYRSYSAAIICVSLSQLSGFSLIIQHAAHYPQQLFL